MILFPKLRSLINSKLCTQDWKQKEIPTSSRILRLVQNQLPADQQSPLTEDLPLCFRVALCMPFLCRPPGMQARLGWVQRGGRTDFCSGWVLRPWCHSRSCYCLTCAPLPVTHWFTQFLEQNKLFQHCGVFITHVPSVRSTSSLGVSSYSS